MCPIINGWCQEKHAGTPEIFEKFFDDSLTCETTIYRSQLDNDSLAVLRNMRLTCIYTSLRHNALASLRCDVITLLRHVVTTSRRQDVTTYLPVNLDKGGTLGLERF